MMKGVFDTIQYGQRSISYRVKFRLRRDTTRKVAIHVQPTGMVEVDAPTGTALSDIKNAIRKRARWVSQHLDDIERQQENITPRMYISGETYFYLGRRHVLKVIETDDSEEVKLLRGQLHIAARDVSTLHLKRLLRTWYRKKANDVFGRRLEVLAKHINWLPDVPSYKLLVMRKQWGSCSPKGVICLNPNLVKAPPECIDYVLLHEICHLKEHNHGDRFYRLLKSHMHNWERVKERLDNMAELLLNE